MVGVRYDMVGRGELRCGKAVEARYGEVRFVQVGRVQAVVVRVGLVGSGVVSQGGRGVLG